MKKITNKTINNYWENYYKFSKFDTESNFAKFVKKKIKINNLTLADIGCGNGRDTVFFKNKGFKPIGYDQSKKIIVSNNKNFGNFFYKEDFCRTNLKLKKKFDIFYLRFFIHAITINMETELLKNIKKLSKTNSLFFCEFRTTRDPLINKGIKISENERYTSHYRRFINIKDFVNKLKKNKFRVIYNKTSYKFAIKKKEKPSICRIIFKNV